MGSLSKLISYKLIRSWSNTGECGGSVDGSSIDGGSIDEGIG